MKIKLFFTIHFVLALSAPLLAQTPDTAGIGRFFSRLAEKNKAMGSLLIVQDGRPQYSRSIGYSQVNASGKTPSSAQNRYRIGSITKMFTAAIVMQLVEEKKLTLEDRLVHFFPQIPSAEKITIRQMLSHRSGIPNVRRGPGAGKNANTLPITKEEMLALIAAGKPGFEPGTKHSYSNSAYYLLGLIIEKITGKPYSEILKERITSKTGLKDTYLATGNIDINKNEALTYMNLGGEWKPVPETHPSILFSAGAIVSTPQDLTRFIQALFAGKIVSMESLAQMKTIVDGDGLGMEPFTFAGKTFYGHAGGADNYGAWLAYQPEEKLAIAYTTNAKVYPVKDIVSGTMDIYYHKPFAIPSFEAVAVSTDVLDQYTGIYSTAEAPVKFTISREGSTLFIQPPGETRAPLEATSQDKFQIEGAIAVEFDVSKKQMIIKRGNGQRVFTKEN